MGEAGVVEEARRIPVCIYTPCVAWPFHHLGTSGRKPQGYDRGTGARGRQPLNVEAGVIAINC